MRVLTRPGRDRRGHLCLPQDVQAQAHDWPVELFDKRVWHIARPLPETRRTRTGRRQLIRAAQRPLVVAGGGVHYTDATDALAAFCEATGIPVGRPRPARARSPPTTRSASGAIGATGTTAANAIAREADLVIGIGTRYSDFTTASRTAFQNPDVGSSTSTSPGSTPSSRPGSASSPTPARRSRR